MSIIRSDRKTDFTVLPNELICDERLKDSHLALLVYLLSKPSDWWIKIEALKKTGRFGSQGKISQTLKYLRVLGYAKLTRMASGHTEWVITDDPTTNVATPAKPPHSENRNRAGNPVNPPHSENPTLDFPNVENRNVLQRKDLDKELKEEDKKQIHVHRVRAKRKQPIPPNPAKQSWMPDTVDLPAHVPRAAWVRFCHHRREIRKPIRPTGCAQMLANLTKWHANGHDATTIIETAISNGWQGLFEPKAPPTAFRDHAPPRMATRREFH